MSTNVSEMAGSAKQEKPFFYQDVKQGVDFMWDNQFEQAEQFFQATKDGNPRHALHYAEVRVMRSFITESHTDRVKALERLYSTIELAESHIKQYEKGVFPLASQYPNEEAHEALRLNHHLDTKIVLGDAYVMLAAAQALSEDSHTTKLKAAFNLRRGWKVYEQELAHLDSESSKHTYDEVVLSCLKFGAGLFFLVLSIIPPVAQKAASWVGFPKGNKELGLRYLTECYRYNNHSSLRAYFAGLMVVLNHFYLSATPLGNQNTSTENNTEDPQQPQKIQANSLFKEADDILNDGLDHYPNGCFFHTVFAISQMDRFDLNTARKSLERAIDNCKDIIEAPPMICRTLTNCYMMSFHWDPATQLIQKMIEQSKTEERSGEDHPSSQGPEGDNGPSEPETENVEDDQNDQKYREKPLRNNALTWHYLKLGAIYAMSDGSGPKAREMFDKVAGRHSTKIKDNKWGAYYAREGKKFSRTGGHLSAFELMCLSGTWDKVLLNEKSSKKEELLNLIEEKAKSAVGASSTLDQLLEKDGAPGQKKRTSSFFGSFMSQVTSYYYGAEEEENTLEVDNRAMYLFFKASVLRSLGRNEEAVLLFEEIVEMSNPTKKSSSVLLKDKLYHVLALLEWGRCCVAENKPKDAMRFFKEASKMSDYVWEENVKHKIHTQTKKLNHLE